MTLFRQLLIVNMIAILSFGCQGEEEQASTQQNTNRQEYVAAVYDTTGEEETERVTKAICVIQPKSDANVVGAVTFSLVEGGVRITADIGGLTPGKHGFHIHEHGDCSAGDGSSAGGHFNPTNKKHGGPDSFERHMGDLGNLEAGSNGFAHYDRIDRVISLNGEYSIIGKSIIIHAGEDDLKSDPTGNAGPRVGCGEIIEAR